MGLGIQTNKSTASADAIDYTPATDDDTEVSQSGEPVDVAGDEYTDEPLTNDEGSGTSLLRQLAGPEFDDPFASPQARDNGVATDGDVEPDGEVATDGDVEPDGEVATDGDVEPDGEVATDGDVEPDGEVATDGDVEPDGEVATDGDVEMDADREPGAGSAVGPADGGLAPSVEAPGLNAGQLGNFNATTEAINESGLEGEAADKALLLLTASGLENNFSNLTGASHQLREGTTGLFNLPAENSMGPLSSEERNDVSSALDGLLDNERSGSLANLASDADVGLGQLSDQLKIGSDNRAVYGEAIDFLAETGAVSPERVENLRGIVAADETLTDKSWEVASFSTNPSETYDYWANDYSPSVGKASTAGERIAKTTTTVSILWVATSQCSRHLATEQWFRQKRGVVAPSMRGAKATATRFGSSMNYRTAMRPSWSTMAICKTTAPSTSRWAIRWKQASGSASRRLTTAGAEAATST